MNTTFRRELDKADVFEDIDAKFKPTYTDIDMKKVKQAVYMETTAKTKTIKFRKKVFFSLIAAVITIVALGSTAIYAFICRTTQCEEYAEDSCLGTTVFISWF